MNLLRSLPEEVRRFLECIGEVAEREGVTAYLVGGAVRDLLLRRTAPDLDLTIEGDALEFSRGLFEAWEAVFPNFPSPKSPVLFKRYGTAKLVFPEPPFPGMVDLDIASARREHYSAPGAIPTVEPGSLRDDLARRDFSINALALLVGPAGVLVDPFGGREDIAARRIRILHPGSFRDDPARLIRAVRFSVRLGFALDPESAAHFRAAVEERLLEAVPLRRRFDELRKALGEKDAVSVVRALDAEGLLGSLLPVEDLTPLVAQLDPQQSDPAAILAQLLRGSAPESIEDLLRRAAVPKQLAAAVRKWRS